MKLFPKLEQSEIGCQGDMFLRLRNKTKNLEFFLSLQSMKLCRASSIIPYFCHFSLVIITFFKMLIFLNNNES